MDIRYKMFSKVLIVMSAMLLTNVEAFYGGLYDPYPCACDPNSAQTCCDTEIKYGENINNVIIPQCFIYAPTNECVYTKFCGTNYCNWGYCTLVPETNYQCDLAQRNSLVVTNVATNCPSCVAPEEVGGGDDL
jgi:hypothetical protein